MHNQTIYLIRHAESTMSGRYCGTTNARLSSRGLRQAHSLKKHFSSIPLEICCSSPLLRARQTAEMICKSKDLPMFNISALSEIHFGKWERRKYTSVASQWQKIYDQWLKDPVQVDIPSGEKFYDFSSRIQFFVLELKKLQRRKIAIVAHAGSLSVLAMILLNKPLDQFWQWIPSVASVTVLQRRQNESFQCIKYNDQSHLGIKVQNG